MNPLWILGDIFLDICIGVFAVWVIRNLSKDLLINRIIKIFMLILLLALVCVYTREGDVVYAYLAVNYMVILLVACADYFVYDRAVALVQEITLRINKPIAISVAADSKDFEFDEEDFMKTKLGKILIVVCVLLVVYMFVSAACIYKLNEKINSVYEITQELK